MFVWQERQRVRSSAEMAPAEGTGRLTLMARASGFTQIGCEDNVKVRPIFASNKIVPITSAMALALAGGTAFGSKRGAYRLFNLDLAA